MKKISIISVGIATVSLMFLFTACNQDNVGANGGDVVRVEGSNIIGDNNYEYYKIVDIETGCKYLVVESYRGVSTTQMMGKNGLPICE